MEEIQMTDAVVPTAATTIDKGDYYLVKKDFDAESSAKGFNFFIVRYKTTAAAVAKLSEATVLGLINTALTLAQRNKAKSQLPETEADKQKAIAAGNVCLMTESEAENFVPGEREPTTLAGLQKAAKEALEEGDKALARVYMKKAIALATKMAEDVERM